MVFHRSLCDCKTSQVSRVLQSILAYFCSAMVWMISIHRLSFSSSSFFSMFVGTVPIVITMIGSSVSFTTFQFYIKDQISIVCSLPSLADLVIF